MIAPPDLDIAGLDTRRLRIIAQRWRSLDKHLSLWFPPDRSWSNVLCSLGRQHQRQLLLAELEQAVSVSNGADPSTIIQRSTGCQEQILIPLAHDLGLVKDAEHTLISMCLSRGWFDPPATKPRERHRPELRKVLPRVKTVLNTFQTIEKRAEALHQQRICRSDRIAQEVAAELTDTHIARHATGKVLHLLGMYSVYGPIGLLSLAPDTAATELFLLEDQTTDITGLTWDVHRVMAEVRRDICRVL